MRQLVVSILIAAAIGSIAGVAYAQKGLSTGPNYDAIENSRRVDENRMRKLEIPRKAGLAALQAQDFVLAEKHFGELVALDPTTSDANYLMGLTQLGLEKWDDAKQYLEIAVKSEPRRPEPKARLGVAYVMTGDSASARRQRDELVALASTCGRCGDAKKIGDNLAMIDRVLAAVAKPAAAPTPAPAG
jgi:Flp pilus assembly protein TadD